MALTDKLEDLVPTSCAQTLVDQLIEERAPRLMQNRLLWSAIKSLAYPALGYQQAVWLVEQVAHLDARGCFDWGERFLKLSVQADDLDHVPDAGAALIIANHPGGIPDGNALWQVLRDKRRDLCFFANRDALRIVPGLRDMIIPVEWRKDDFSRARARDTLRAARTAFQDGRCVVISPAGRMADWSWRHWRLKEPAWAATGVSMARKHNAPIIPLGVRQRMPLAYYILAQLHEELRDITLFHGLLNQRGAAYRLRFGAPVRADALPREDQAATDQLKAMCEALAWAPQGPASP